MIRAPTIPASRSERWRATAVQDPGGPFQGRFTREASWTAVALYRFRCGSRCLRIASDRPFTNWPCRFPFFCVILRGLRAYSEGLPHFNEKRVVTVAVTVFSCEVVSLTPSAAVVVEYTGVI
jgi:hypothetical protein